MKGLCFNCLSRDHKVACCHNSTRCCRCHQFGHTSRDCFSCSLEQPLKSPPCDIGGNSAPSNITKDFGADIVVDDSLLLVRQSTPLMVCDRMMDPMLLEALLIDQSSDTKRGSSTRRSADTSRCAINHHPLLQEIQTPQLLRSEEEQLVGQELIKVLKDFKQLAVTPLSPHTHQLNSFVKDFIVEGLINTQRSNHHRRTKFKSRKPVVKVVRDMLIKKWVLVKKDKQLSTWTEVMRFLETLRLPP